MAAKTAQEGVPLAASGKPLATKATLGLKLSRHLLSGKFDTSPARIH
jgi:hypothetical protein